MAETFSLAPERIAVVPNGTPRSSHFHAPDSRRIQEKMTNHPARLRLCYPALGHPHKNHEILPETFRILRDTYGIDDVAIFVTVEPADSFNARNFLLAVDALGLNRQIVNLGRLDQPEVATVYRYSHGLLMPTLLESFSLTYLDAMQFGVPILTSDYYFAREVCADAAWYFDPLDPNAIASVIARFSRRSGTVSDLRGRVDATPRQDRISWNDVTDRYVAVLRQACGQLEGPHDVRRRNLDQPADRDACNMSGLGL
jgi:glycosyltransferase involved in cell wall biosynthesis